MAKINMTRRDTLVLGAAAPATALLPAALAAETVTPKPSNFGWSPEGGFALGEMRITPIRAGSGISEAPIDTFGLGVDPEDFAGVAAANFLPTDRSGSSFTPVLIESGRQLILVDTGLKPEETVAGLAEVGVVPDQITHVLLTHMHGDHIGGLMGEGPTFPKAELIVPKLENDYWSGQENAAYQAKVAPLIGKARQIGDGDEILPGIRAEAAYGHTPGHTTYLLTSGEARLLLTGDSFNHYAFSVARPDWKVRFDVDKERGIETRKRVLSRLAAERIPFIGYHMPFPAVGFIAAEGEGYRYQPATYQFAG